MRRSASGDGCEAVLLELGEDEGVDRGCGPAGQRGLGQRDVGGRPSGCSDHQSRLIGRPDADWRPAAGLAVARVGRAHLDPLAEIGDDRAGSLPLGGIGSTPSAPLIA